MEKIPLPTSVRTQPGKDTRHNIIIIEPFFPGYGTTIGNAIRRNLLSTLAGAAVTSFKIKGGLHEFSAIPHIKEDVIEFTLNLKMLRLKIFTEQPVRLFLKATGERKVTAADIEPNSDVEIINKNLHIATLTDKKASLEIEMIVTSGRGYVPTEAKEKEVLEQGMISVDSNFSPIERIGFRVENVRVGQMTNWDKLILDIVTDGTLTPQEAVHAAVKDLLDHLSFIEQKIFMESAEEGEKKEEISIEKIKAEDTHQEVKTEEAEIKKKRKYKKHVE